MNPTGTVERAPAAARVEGPVASAHAWHGVDHAENFPVASWLVPRRMREAMVAIYHFARHADDIADEGVAEALARDRELLALDALLHEAASGRATGHAIIDALIAPMRVHALDWRHLHDLIDAFRQDVRITRYPDPNSVQDYCERSANPVGRLMLELFGVGSAGNRVMADAICSALQRINFLQDVLIDRDKDRVYLPLSTLAQAGIAADSLDAALVGPAFAPALIDAIRIEAARAHAQMRAGAPLVTRVPFRFGLELRFIIAGGLRILERLAMNGYDPARDRPVLGWRDLAALLRLALKPFPTPPANAGLDHEQ